MKTIKWNTRRIYTEYGQRIAAVEVPDINGVYFADVDRMVDGTIAECPLEPDAIMARYDQCQYKGGTPKCVRPENISAFRACVERVAKRAYTEEVLAEMDDIERNQERGC